MLHLGYLNCGEALDPIVALRQIRSVPCRPIFNLRRQSRVGRYVMGVDERSESQYVLFLSTFFENLLELGDNLKIFGATCGAFHFD